MPTSAVMQQEAVGKLLIWSPSVPATMRLPSIRAPAGWFKWLPTRPHNRAPPIPDILWRSTSTSTEDSTGDAKADLVDAAMFLLENAALAGPIKPSEQQTIGALAAKDWTAFVRKCTAAKPRAFASSRLLAMRNAVPSPSARMVFQSQVGPNFRQNWCLSAAIAQLAAKIKQS